MPRDRVRSGTKRERGGRATPTAAIVVVGTPPTFWGAERSRQAGDRVRGAGGRRVPVTVGREVLAALKVTPYGETWGASGHERSMRRGTFLFAPAHAE